MSRLRFRFTVPALGVCVAALGLAVFGANALGAGQGANKSAAAMPTAITVLAGKPTELAFKLTKTSSVPLGTVTFKVTNMGIAYHDFKLCIKPVTSPSTAQNACVGKATPILKHGQSATLKVTIAKNGLYEYLCTVPGHAAAGMKGLLGVGMAVTAAQEKLAAKAGASAASTTTTSQYSSSSGANTTTTTAGGGTTTTKSGGGGGGNANPCPPGQTIQTAGNTDADGDEQGTEPDDNDGCI
jgi:uncharacterized cupredoxin-like copper-binding protein